MGIFGLGKKSDGDEDSGRRALFGSRSKNKSPPENPYAQPGAPPDPYTQAKMNAGIIPPAQRTVGPRLPPGSGMGLPTGPSMKNGYDDVNDSRYSTNKGGNDAKFGTPSGGYGIPDGYRDDKYGKAGGYGTGNLGGNTYGVGMPAAASSGYGPDGYGGLGRSNSMETTSTDANRTELFGDASQRVQQSGVNAYEDPPPYAGQASSYRAYGDRQMTAEEEEEEDIEATKQEIKGVKKDTVQSTRNVIRVVAGAEETARNTLARLGAQGESLYHTEKNLNDTMAAQYRAGLKTNELGKGMFHVKNPFTAGEGEKMLEGHDWQRRRQEETRKAAFASTQGMIHAFKDMGTSSGTQEQKPLRLAERAKYQFEADEEDDKVEEEIKENLETIGDITTRLNGLAKAQGQALESQNEVLDRMRNKGEILDRELAINNHKLLKASR